MRKFLLSFAVITTAMCFSSCSKDDAIINVEPGEQVEIKVGARALDVIANTRAPFEGAVGAENELNARVIASTSLGVYTSLLHDNFMNFGDVAVGFTIPKAYPHATKPVYLVGLYPSTGWDTTVATGSKISTTFTGKEDVMASNEVSTVKNDVISNTQKTLTFHHLLTRLNLTIKAKDADAIAAWGNVTSLKVVSPDNKVTVTLGTGDAANTAPTATFEADGVNPFDFYAGETAYCTSPQALTLAPAAAQSYSMVSPKDNSGTSNPIIYTIKLKTGNHTAEKEVNVPLTVTAGGSNFIGNTAGKMFNILLTFTATEIEAKATVKAWDAGGNTELEVN